MNNIGAWYFDGVDDHINFDCPLSTAPQEHGFTSFARFNVSSGYSGNNVFLSLVDASGFNDYFDLWMHTNNRVVAATRADSGGIESLLTGSDDDVLPGAWASAAMLNFSATEREMYTSTRKAVGSGVTTINTANIDRISVGCQARSTARSFYQGHIADVAVWHGTLSPDKCQRLMHGAVPSDIDPHKLVFYCPLDNPVPTDIVSGAIGTIVGAPEFQPIPVTNRKRRRKNKVLFLPSADAYNGYDVINQYYNSHLGGAVA